jgi:membrane-associated protein
MSYGYFFSYNVIGGIVWVPLFTFSGYFFGTLPFVQRNFELVIIAIILISLIPVFYEAWKSRSEKVKAAAP